MAEIEERKDVVYGDAGNRPLRLDLYRPAERNGAAAIIVHGGGWSRGSKDMLVNHCRHLARQGFVALAQEYRLTGEAPFPACIHDVKRAIRWPNRTPPSSASIPRSSASRATRPARTWCC